MCRPVLDSSLQQDEKLTMGKLFTLAMFGSLDDFAVQVSLMLAGVLTGSQLAVGVFLGRVFACHVGGCAFDMLLLC